MNTNKETATYDPETKDVTINPTNKKNDKLVSNQGLAVPVLADGGKINLQENIEQPSQSSEPPPDNTIKNESYMAQGGSFNDNSVLVGVSASPMNNQCPSFARAMSASEFKKTGNHFDNGTTNLR